MAEKCDDYELHNAAYYGNIDTLKSLLSAGQSVNSRNQKGNAPLVSALAGISKKERKVEIVDLLMNDGAEINAINNDGDSILHVAVKISFRKTISKQIIQQLIDHGADNKLLNNRGQTASQLAFQSNNAKLGTLLLFYEKPEPKVEERPRCSKTQINGHVPSMYYSVDTLTNTKKKRPGLMRSLIEYIYPKTYFQRHLRSDLDKLRSEKPLMLVDGDENETKNVGSYSEDFNRLGEILETHRELSESSNGNKMEIIYRNESDDEDFIEKLNENKDLKVKTAVLINKSNEEIFPSVDENNNRNIIVHRQLNEINDENEDEKSGVHGNIQNNATLQNDSFDSDKCIFCRMDFQANVIIFQCCNGHVYGECCKNITDTCAVCKVDISNSNIRNLVLEKILRNEKQINSSE